MASTLGGLQRLEEVQPAAEQQNEQANIRSAEAVSNLESKNFSLGGGNQLRGWRRLASRSSLISSEETRVLR